MEKTLVHEDIYAYIDPITETEDKKAGNSVSFINDAREGIADNGRFYITVISGSLTKIDISDGYKTLNINQSLSLGDSLLLDFNNMVFKKNEILFFLDDFIELNDNEYHVINVNITGTGTFETTYTFMKIEQNFEDVMYLEGISVETSIDRPKKTLLSGKEKTLKGEKKVHSFSINGLWNQDEISKFTSIFRMRLVDEEGTKLNTLANCRINSNGKSSSSGGDLTFSISGSCEEIF